MKKMLFVLTLLMLVTFISEAKAIQKPAPVPDRETSASTVPEKTMKFSGMIVKIHEVGLAIDVKGKMMKEKKLLTFLINDKTRITKGKTMIIPSDLKQDMWVSVVYKKEKDKMMAVAIDVLSHKQ
jgi:hypothetical protein